jgi:hypothetical protein
MAAERRQFQDDEAIESQMLDQALGRYDGHVFVRLPNAPATLETESEGYRLHHPFGLGGRRKAPQVTDRVAMKPPAPCK